MMMDFAPSRGRRAMVMIYSINRMSIGCFSCYNWNVS